MSQYLLPVAEGQMPPACEKGVLRLSCKNLSSKGRVTVKCQRPRVKGDRRILRGCNTRRLRITGSPLGTGNHTLSLGLRGGNNTNPS